MENQPLYTPEQLQVVNAQEQALGLAIIDDFRWQQEKEAINAGNAAAIDAENNGLLGDDLDRARFDAEDNHLNGRNTQADAESYLVSLGVFDKDADPEGFKKAAALFAKYAYAGYLDDGMNTHAWYEDDGTGTPGREKFAKEAAQLGRVLRENNPAMKEVFNERRTELEANVEDARNRVIELSVAREKAWGKKKHLDEYNEAKQDLLQSYAAITNLLYEQGRMLGDSDADINKLIKNGMEDAVSGLISEKLIIEAAVCDQMAEQGRFGKAARAIGNLKPVAKFRQLGITKKSLLSGAVAGTTATIATGGLAAPVVAIAASTALFSFGRRAAIKLATGSAKKWVDSRVEDVEDYSDQVSGPTNASTMIETFGTHLDESVRVVKEHKRRERTVGIAATGLAIGLGLGVGHLAAEHIGNGGPSAEDLNTLRASVDGASTEAVDAAAQVQVIAATAFEHAQQAHDAAQTIAATTLEQAQQAQEMQAAQEAVRTFGAHVADTAEQLTTSHTYTVGKGEGWTYMLADMRQELGLSEDQVSNRALYDIYKQNEDIFSPEHLGNATYDMGNGDYGASAAGDITLDGASVLRLHTALQEHAGVPVDTSVVDQIESTGAAPIADTATQSAPLTEALPGIDYGADVERSIPIPGYETPVAVDSATIEQYLVPGSTGEQQLINQLTSISSDVAAQSEAIDRALTATEAKRIVSENAQYFIDNADQITTGSGELYFTPDMYKHFSELIEEWLRQDELLKTGAYN